MPTLSLTKRVEILEKTVSGPSGLVGEIASLRDAVTSIGHDLRTFRTEFQQFSGETRAEFSAVRGEMRTEFAAVRDEMQTEFAAVRSEMRTEFAAVRDEMRTEVSAVRAEMGTEFVAVRHEIGDLRAEMNTRFESVDRRFTGLEAGLQQTRTEMRVLHEEVLSRISLLGESLGGASAQGR